MSKKLRKKAAVMFLVEAVCLVVLGVFLTVMQTNLSIRNQGRDTKEKIQQMQGLIDEADKKAEQNIESYDEVYRSKAASIAYMANKDKNFAYTDAKMKELADMMNISNIIIIDRKGIPIVQAHDSKADFSFQRFNQLRTVFETGEPSEAFEVEIGGDVRRYYSAKIDDEREAVIEHDPEELHQLQENTSSWESILSKVSVGLDGYAFAVSSQDYTFQYHPDKDMIGQDALIAGLDVADLEDNHYGWMEIDGERFYCGVKQIDTDNAYVICAVPEKEIAASRNITVGIVLFIFFIVITIVVIYAILLLNEQEQEGETSAKDFKVLGGMNFNKLLSKKLASIMVVGLIFVLIVSFYMQTLFSLSLHSMSNNKRVQEVQETLEHNADDIELITSQYNRRYLNKCQVAAYILGGNPQLQTREELQELSQVLGVEFLIVFDKDGKEKVTDSDYIDFEISDDPKEQSYEFRKLLQGVKYVIQEAQPDEVSGEYYQYIGVVIYGEDGEPDGFVQISIVPDKLEGALAATKLSSVLDGVKTGVNGFAFAVDKKDKIFTHYPKKRMDGKNALQYGMEEKQFRDGYSDYITIDGQKYYGSCLETSTDYVYVVIPDKEMTGTRLPVAITSTGVSLLCLLLIFVLLVFSPQKKAEEEMNQEHGDDGPMVDVVMPDGSVRKTEAAASRWANITVKWGEKTPEQQVATVMKGMLGILALVICVAVLFKDNFFGEDSIFLYVLNGKWEKSVNVFAITGCIMIICVVSVAVMLIRKVLKMLSRTFGARGETVCRLISSFTKYLAVIAILYYCFALFGVDTKTLLASAGILSLVIGLGARTLVSDILAGLFIIFEGEFQVGDIVTIGDWRGTVLEIGVRTTKIEDPGNNVKIISNSEVSGVINMTRRNSFTSCDVGIEYGESLEKVENILAKELPNIKKRVPTIKEGPFYKGVVSLGDNSVNIRIVAQCREADRIQLARDLNREMKILFDKYDINIPYPQVVINQPREYEKATEWEKMRADAFNRSQKEMSKALGEESEERN